MPRGLEIGARGFRVLDSVRFAIEVVALNDNEKTLSVRFADDDTVEHGVEWDEFEFEIDASQAPQASSRANDGGVLQDPLLIGRIASFLDHFQWIMKLIRVNSTWKTALLSAIHWHQLRLPADVDYRRLRRLLEVKLDTGGTSTVGQALHQLALDDSTLTDDQVLALVHQCPVVQHISLRRCSHVSFMLVYELQQLSRERHKAATSGQSQCLKTLDLWLCRGISPSYVSQLTTNRQSKQTTLTIHGPGFYHVEVSVAAYRALCELASPVDGWKLTKLEVTWLDKSTLLDTLASMDSDSMWAPLRRFVPLFKVFSTASLVPLVRLDSLLSTHSEAVTSVGLGLPVTMADDLCRLIDEYESQSTRPYLRSIIACLTATTTITESDNDKKEEDPLDAQATRVFAMLRKTTEELQNQVDHLEQQVTAMTSAKNKAEQEYKTAERELKRVAHEADRALLSLATSTDLSSSTAKKQEEVRAETIAPPPQNGVVTNRPEDTFLPTLPPTDQIIRVASDLERQAFAVLDGFVGRDLSTQVRQDAERMYTTSRDEPPSPPPLQSTVLPVPPPPPPTAVHTENDSDGRFRLGELAGGNTGRNLRYQMAHVRGDYVLWMDEHDKFCPRSIRLALRQLDRLILERLSVQSHELSMSALLRKKAMVTCYPGKSHARYTRHCDNPNRNGRKLTAILYLNDDWDSALHGGELLLHLEPNAVRVAPVLDRLLLFFSDKRVPHEVLSCQDETRDRYALTVWYLDYDEYMHAQVFGTVAKDGGSNGNEVERKRIEEEIQRLAIDSGDGGA